MNVCVVHSQALRHPYFTTKPLPADPASLPAIGARKTMFAGSLDLDAPFLPPAGAELPTDVLQVLGADRLDRHTVGPLTVSVRGAATSDGTGGGGDGAGGGAGAGATSRGAAGASASAGADGSDSDDSSDGGGAEDVSGRSAAGVAAAADGSAAGEEETCRPAPWVMHLHNQASLGGDSAAPVAVVGDGWEGDDF